MNKPHPLHDGTGPWDWYSTHLVKYGLLFLASYTLHPLTRYNFTHYTIGAVHHRLHCDTGEAPTTRQGWYSTHLVQTRSFDPCILHTSLSHTVQRGETWIVWSQFQGEESSPFHLCVENRMKLNPTLTVWIIIIFSLQVPNRNGVSQNTIRKGKFYKE